MAIVIC